MTFGFILVVNLVVKRPSRLEHDDTRALNVFRRNCEEKILQKKHTSLQKDLPIIATTGSFTWNVVLWKFSLSKWHILLSRECDGMQKCVPRKRKNKWLQQWVKSLQRAEKLLTTSIFCATCITWSPWWFKMLASTGTTDSFNLGLCLVQWLHPWYGVLPYSYQKYFWQAFRGDVSALEDVQESYVLLLRWV